MILFWFIKGPTSCYVLLRKLFSALHHWCQPTQPPPTHNRSDRQIFPTHPNKWKKAPNSKRKHHSNPSSPLRRRTLEKTQTRSSSGQRAQSSEAAWDQTRRQVADWRGGLSSRKQDASICWARGVECLFAYRSVFVFTCFFFFLIFFQVIGYVAGDKREGYCVCFL